MANNKQNNKFEYHEENERQEPLEKQEKEQEQGIQEKAAGSPNIKTDKDKNQDGHHSPENESSDETNTKSKAVDIKEVHENSEKASESGEDKVDL